MTNSTRGMFGFRDFKLLRPRLLAIQIEAKQGGAVIRHERQNFFKQSAKHDNVVREGYDDTKERWTKQLSMLTSDRIKLVQLRGAETTLTCNSNIS